MTFREVAIYFLRGRQTRNITAQNDMRAYLLLTEYESARKLQTSREETRKRQFVLRSNYRRISRYRTIKG